MHISVYNPKTNTRSDYSPAILQKTARQLRRRLCAYWLDVPADKITTYVEFVEGTNTARLIVSCPNGAFSEVL